MNAKVRVTLYDNNWLFTRRWIIHFLHKLNGLRVAMACPVGKNPRSLNRANWSIIGVILLYELGAWELPTCAAVFNAFILRAGIDSTFPPEWLPI